MSHRPEPAVTPPINYAGARQEKYRAAFTRDAGKRMRMTKLLESATPRNLPHTAICPVCGDRFARGRHSNRHKAADLWRRAHKKRPAAGCNGDGANMR